MDTHLIIKSGDKDLAIKGSGNRFGVFVASQAVDWFNDYNGAATLIQDIHISRSASDDEAIGTVKFCPSALGNGSLVVVVAKIKNGYLVQRTETHDRFPVTADILSDPPTTVKSE